MKRAAQRIVAKLRLHGYETFFAGGWVRDFLMHRKPKDIDIATSALPDEILRLFPNARSIGAQFGVIQVLMYGHPYEVATFRSDREYKDGRHPSSVLFSSPEQDALRRDFTINGMFYDPMADRLIDYVHGKNDIREKIVRTIGDPYARFAEDKLRMLRAIRFSCSLGFSIESETWNALRKLAPDILQVSQERIRDELIELLIGPAPGLGLSMLQDSGLLIHILPEMEALREIPQSSLANPKGNVLGHICSALSLLHKPSAILAFGTLLHDIGKSSAHQAVTNAPFEGHAHAGAKICEEICRRLRMSNEETDQIVDLVSTHRDFAQVCEMSESALRKLLRKPNINDHLELFRVNCISNQQSLELYSICRRKLAEYTGNPAAAPLINGEDLIELGYSPGPIFKKILETVEDWQLDSIVRTHEDALKRVKDAFPIEKKI